MNKQNYEFSELFSEDNAPQVYRTIKDRLFRFIFTRPDHKDWALNLFNSMEGTNYTNPDDLEVVVMENAIYMNMRNDVAVLVSSWNLSFFEHQSTLCPNLPLRMLGYVSSKLLSYVSEKKLNIYGPVRLTIPFPRFHVVYNGIEKAPETEVLKLSDMYYNYGEDSEPMLELKVIQHNINGYKNGKNHCRQLYEFQWITDTFRSFLDQGLTALEAIENTLNQIPPDFTIRDLLLQYRNEVTDMWLFEYDRNEHIAMERRDSEARGEARGKVEERVRILKRKIGKGMTFEQACADLELTEKEIEEIKSSF